MPIDCDEAMLTHAQQGNIVNSPLAETSAGNHWQFCRAPSVKRGLQGEKQLHMVRSWICEAQSFICFEDEEIVHMLKAELDGPPGVSQTALVMVDMPRLST